MAYEVVCGIVFSENLFADILLHLSPKIRMDLARMANLNRPNCWGEGEPIFSLCKPSCLKQVPFGERFAAYRFIVAETTFSKTDFFSPVKHGRLPYAIAGLIHMEHVVQEVIGIALPRTGQHRREDIDVVQVVSDC